MMNNFKFTYLLLIAAVLINFSGLLVPIIGTDGTLYASIAKTMALSNNYSDLFAMGSDWLDKPHMPFWITAFFFELFGISTWTYKIPAILIMLMGAYYTYRFAKELYNKEIALWSTIILLTAQHTILSNNDVRAEPYLTGFIIASLYHFYRTLSTKQWMHLIAGSFFAACAIMTKGMFALIPLCAAIGGELLMKKRWKDLFHLRWLAAAILVLLFITPELYSVYIQFDLHPEKTVFGKQGVSGLRFFFWDSQFGRFFNTGPIRGKGDLSFFLHTMLWAFLPWSLIWYAALIQWFRKNFRNPQQHEWYCFFGGLATFLVFSISKFQLPHYLNIVFPLFAIMTAQYLFSLKAKPTLRLINGVQTGIIILLVLLAITLQWFFKPEHTSWVAVAVLILLLAAILLIPASTLLQKIMYRTALASLFVNIFLNWIFYPNLMKYQSGSEAGMWLNEHYKNMPVVQLKEAPYSSQLEFYLDQPLQTIDSAGHFPERPFIVYKPDRISYSGPGKVTAIRKLEHYHISLLNGKFLNKATRGEKTEMYGLFLVR